MKANFACLLPVVLLVIFSPDAAIAQQNEWRRYADDGSREILAGRVDEGMKIVAASRALAMQITDPSAFAEAARVLAKIYSFTSQPEEAVTVLERAVSLLKSAADPDPALLARSLDMLAQNQLAAHKTSEAERNSAEAKSLLEQTSRAEPRMIVDNLTTVGRVQAEQGHYDEAQKTFEKAVELSEQVKGPGTPLAFWAMQELATLYGTRRQGTSDPRQKAKWLASEQQAWERVLPMFDLRPDDDLKASVYTNLANAYIESGQAGRAAPLLEKALACAEKFRGKESPQAAVQLGSLAQCYVKMNRLGEAEHMLAQELAVTEKLHVPPDLEVSSVLRRLGDVLADEQKYAVAEQTYLRAAAVFEKQQGNKDEMTMGRLGTLYGKQQRFGEQERAYRDLLSAQQQSHGERPPWVPETLQLIAETLQRQGRLREAAETCNQAAAIYKKNTWTIQFEKTRETCAALAAQAAEK